MEIAGLGHEIGYHYENLESVVRGQWSVVSKIKNTRRKKSSVREFTRMDTNEELNMSFADRKAHNFIASGEGGYGVRSRLHHLWQGLRGKVNNKEDTEKLIHLGYEDFCRNLKRFREIVDVKTICMHGSPMSRYDNRMIWEKYDYRELGIIGEPYFDVDYKEVFYITDTGRRWNHGSASVRDRVESGFDIEVRSTGHLIEMLERREEEVCPPQYHHKAELRGRRNTRNSTKEERMNYPPGKTPVISLRVLMAEQFHGAGNLADKASPQGGEELI